jgi:hypothetical protein
MTIELYQEVALTCDLPEYRIVSTTIRRQSSRCGNFPQQFSTIVRPQGRYEEAEPLFLQALAIAEQTLGENHPTTVIIQENLQKMRQQQHPSS